MRTKIALALLVAAALLTTACSSSETGGPQRTALTGKAAEQYLVDHLKARRASVDGVYVEASFKDLLPDQKFSIDGSRAASLTQGLVVGEVVDVRPGRGYVVGGEDAAQGQEVAFAAPDAQWKTVVLRIAVSQAWGEVGHPDEVSLAMVIDGRVDAESAMNGFLELGRVIVPVMEQNQCAYAQPAYLARQGDLLGTVSNSGEIAFPALADDGRAFLGATDTLGEVASEIEQPQGVVEVTTVDGVFVREAQPEQA